MGGFYTFLAPVSVSAADAVAESAMDRLAAGEVVLEETRLDEKGGSVRAMILIHAPARSVWRVISSCEHALSYLEGMEECEVLVDTPERALTRHIVDPGWLVPKMDYVFEIRRRQYSRMDFELIEGNLKEMEGYWHLEPEDSALLVEHEVRLRPMAPVPRWFVRRKLKSSLPQMMTCIRGLAGGSPSSEMARNDRSSCPGPEGGGVQ